MQTGKIKLTPELIEEARKTSEQRWEDFISRSIEQGTTWPK